MSDARYDAVIIGAGQGGDPLARAFAAAGRRTALIERKAVGGTCVNTGCTPTKTMLASARIAHLARRAGDYGVRTGDVQIDLAAVHRRTNAIRNEFRDGTEAHLLGLGVELIYGQARLTGPRTISVNGERTLEADLIFLNVGSRPALPEIEGLDESDYLTEGDLEGLDHVPDHLLILGGGYIALEFGQMFRRFGSRVTLLQRGPRLLEREDPDVSDALAAILREEGIEIVFDAQAFSGVRNGDGTITVTLQTPAGETSVTGSHLVSAIGRTPNTDGLGLDAAGVEIDNAKFVKTNSRLETTAPDIYALGDCKGGPAFTHISYDDFRILRANLLNGGRRSTEDRFVPYTVFTDPQLGRVGMTETEANAAGRRYRVARLPMTETARGIETGETRGFLKALVNAEDDQILGCAFLGIEGGELMTVVETAMMGKLPYTALRDGVFAHPTLAESLNNLFMTLP